MSFCVNCQKSIDNVTCIGRIRIDNGVAKASNFFMNETNILIFFRIEVRTVGFIGGEFFPIIYSIHSSSSSTEQLLAVTF